MIYIVFYSKDFNEDYVEEIIFATKSKKKAVNYRNKYNKILKYWKKYYSQFTKDGWIKPEYEKLFENWNKLRLLNGCFIKRVETR